MIKNKIMLFLASIFLLPLISAGTIYDVFDIKNLSPYFDDIKQRFATYFGDIEQPFVTIEDIPDEIGNIIAQKIIADNPQFNEAAKTFKVLRGHKSSVYSVAWSPDGTKLASGSWNKTIIIWDAVSGLVLQTLQGHTDLVYSVAWSPDGTKLASGSADGTIKVWDMVDGSLQQSQLLTGHESSLSSVAWSPDGTKLASGSGDNTIKIWDAVSGSLLQTLTGHTGSVYSVAWSPDGTKLASGSDDNTIKIWDAVSGLVLQTLQGHTNSVKSVAWSPDGTKLASGSWDKTIKIWDMVGGSLQLSQTLQGHTDIVKSVAWSPDGTKLASGSWDKTIKIWDMVGGSLQLSQTFTGHTEGARSVAWSPDGTKLAFGSNNRIGIWSLYLLGPADIQNITLEQFLLLKLLYAKNIALRYQWVREKRTNPHAKLVDSIDLASIHDKLLGSEAQQILSTFSDEARNRIIKRYNIVGYTSSPKRENDENSEKSPRIRHQVGSAAAASSSGYVEDAMDTN